MAVVNRLAFEDIDECLYRILKDSLVYLNSRGIPIDPMTEKTYLYYKKYLGKEEACSMTESSKKMALAAYRALDEKKGSEIRVIDISNVSVIADYFVIITGNSSSQVNALVDSVEEKMHKAGFSLRQERRTRQAGWVPFLDYNILSFIFLIKENRSFYNLEHVWATARR